MVPKKKHLRHPHATETEIRVWLEPPPKKICRSNTEVSGHLDLDAIGNDGFQINQDLLLFTNEIRWGLSRLTLEVFEVIVISVCENCSVNDRMIPILREAQDEGQLSGSPVQFPGAKNLQKLNLKRDHEITHVIKPRGESAKPRIWFFFDCFVFFFRLFFDCFVFFAYCLIIFLIFLRFRFDSCFFWFFGVTFLFFLIFNCSSNIGRYGIVTVHKTRRAWSKRGHDFKKKFTTWKNCTTCAPKIVINLWSQKPHIHRLKNGVTRAIPLVGADLVPPARGKGWVSKMDADTKEGNTDDECCDRTDGGGVPKWCFFLDVIIVWCQGSNHRTSEDDEGVCNFLPKRKVTKVP